jgi:hypothetical protein
MQERHDKSLVAGRAAEGERVTICIETIKADKKAVFDRLLHDVLGPAGLEANSRVFENTRLIEPSEANPDGTWSYVSIQVRAGVSGVLCGAGEGLPRRSGVVGGAQVCRVKPA